MTVNTYSIQQEQGLVEEFLQNVIDFEAFTDLVEQNLQRTAIDFPDEFAENDEVGEWAIDNAIKQTFQLEYNMKETFTFVYEQVKELLDESILHNIVKRAKREVALEQMESPNPYTYNGVAQSNFL